MTKNFKLIRDRLNIDNEELSGNYLINPLSDIKLLLKCRLKNGLLANLKAYSFTAYAYTSDTRYQMDVVKGNNSSIILHLLEPELNDGELSIDLIIEYYDLDGSYKSERLLNPGIYITNKCPLNTKLNNYSGVLILEDSLEPDTTHCLTFKSLSGDSYIRNDSIPNNITYWYSYNGVTWKIFDKGKSISFTDELYIKGHLTGSAIYDHTPTLYIGGSASVSGDIRYIWTCNNESRSVSEFCLSRLFKGPGLIDANNLLFTYNTLSSYCYSELFKDCTSLVSAPELPTINLSEGCYKGMFSGCTSLATAPELPVTILVNSCYESMFQGCTSLTAAPKLPAKSLVDSCYNEMFKDCHSLNYIKCLAEDNLTEDCTNDWVDGVASQGTFIRAFQADWEIDSPNGIPIGWTTQDEELPGVKFFANSNSTISINKLSTNQTLLYRYDYSNWSLLYQGSSINLSSGEHIYIKGQLTGDNTNRNYTQFRIIGNVEIIGDSKLLWDKDNINDSLYDYCGYYMFYDCDGITSAKRFLLSSSECSDNCYQFMFSYCDSLVYPPILAATILSSNCYFYMFYSCRSLIEAPKLPALELANYCYCYMFTSCSSLTKAPELPATILADGCYSHMLESTPITQAPVLPATELYDSCYSSMFEGCLSLTQAPDLPATTLTNNCYSNMFRFCSNLTKAPKLEAKNLVNSCYYQMFRGCEWLSSIICLAENIYTGSTREWLQGVSSTGVFYKSSNMYDWGIGESGIPEGWTIEEYPD